MSVSKRKHIGLGIDIKPYLTKENQKYEVIEKAESQLHKDMIIITDNYNDDYIYVIKSYYKCEDDCYDEDVTLINIDFANIEIDKQMVIEEIKKIFNIDVNQNEIKLYYIPEYT